MLRDWLDEYRRHPIPAGILAFTGSLAIIIFAITWTIRHTHELPRHPPAISKTHHTKTRPAPTVTITEQPTATPIRTITQAPEVTRPATPHRKKSDTPSTPAGETTAPAPTTETPTQTTPTPTEPPPTSPDPTETAPTTPGPSLTSPSAPETPTTTGTAT